MTRLLQIQIDDSPTYKIGKRLGKGGFGQVYVGHAITGGSISSRTGRGAAEVCILGSFNSAGSQSTHIFSIRLKDLCLNLTGGYKI